MLRTLVSAFLTVVLLSPAFAQVQGEDVRELMFADAAQARDAAVAANAKELSPRNFENGLESYNQASRDYQQNRNLARIRSALVTATEHFSAARKVSEQASIALAAMIKTRTDARKADAGLHDADTWRLAERRFHDAIAEFERGDARDAQRRAADAEELFRKAELAAIKADLLNETRRLLNEAESARAERYAPATFARARRLLADAEKALNENRYDTDQPRDLARQAQYEARHALYLTQRVQVARRDDTTFEDLILAGETPLHQIATNADLSVSFDEGYEEATASIIAYLRNLENQKRELEQDLYERAAQIEALQTQLASLEKRYGGIDEERRLLEEQLQRQAQEREKFRRLESIFHDEQADVLRSGNDIVIRLVGSSFPVGSSTIEQSAYGLLRQLIQALELFPNARLRIEGHTDSFGGDASNLKLSQERASAVQAYLLANSSIAATRIEAEGFGETRPIANNETREGRARNRRIDVVIKP